MANGTTAATASSSGLNTTPSAPLPSISNYLDPRQDGIDLTYYVTDPTSLAAGGSFPSQINIDSGTDFYWVATSYFADIAGAAVTESSMNLPLVTVVITDTGSQRQLMNAPVPLPAIAGSGERPARLLLPRLFRANSVIQFNWANYSADTEYSNLYLTMWGFRLPPGTRFTL